MKLLLSSRLIMGLALVTLGLVLTLFALMFRSPSSANAESTAPATGPLPPMDAKPLTARGGIPNVAAKLKAGGDVTVAFIGGPITSGGGESGFAPLVVRWLTAQYPAARVKLVNAGLIDGGSGLGATRIDRDVFPRRPDLLFVEFAVDDEGEPTNWHVERLVRKARAHNPRLDVVLLYAIAEPHLPEFRAGKLPAAASAHERVAAHYDLPSIAMGAEVVAGIDAGKRTWGDLFSEGWRPTRAGYAAYSDAIIAGLGALLRNPGPPRDHATKEPPPMNAGMVLYPASRPAATMPAPPPMKDDAGRVARVTYAMPLVAHHWVGSSEFKDETGRVLWRLFTQSVRDNGRRLNADFGLDRSRWGPPMEWFEEYGYFTGPAGIYLVHGSRGKSNHLTAREDDLPLVTFSAPQAGRYLVRVKSGDAVFWGLNRSLALNVVHFPAGAQKGRSIAFQRTQAGIAESANITAEVRLAAGDDIAFQLDTNALGGGGAAFRDVEISVGWFGE